MREDIPSVDGDRNDIVRNAQVGSALLGLVLIGSGISSGSLAEGILGGACEVAAIAIGAVRRARNRG